MSETVCPTNINRAGKRRRMILGVVVLAGTTGWHVFDPPVSGSIQLLAEFGLCLFGWLCVMQAAAGT